MSFKVTRMPDIAGFAERFGTAEVDKKLETAARATEEQAKLEAPTGADSRLRSSITANRIGPMQWKVGTTVNYAAFVEFGTGTVGRGSDQPGGVPSWYQHGTPPFKGPWPGMAEFDRWAKRVGVDNPGAVAHAIRQRGIKAQPFLRPAFFTAEKLLKKPAFWRQT